PRPAVLPMPDPGPRPLRMRARCEPRGACRSCSARRGYWISEPGAWALFLERGFRVVFAFAFGVTSCLPFQASLLPGDALAGACRAARDDPRARRHPDDA